MSSTISSLAAANSIDASADYLAIDTASLSTTQKINRNTLLELSSTPVGINDSQTLTNKTLTSPTISSPTLSGTLAGTYTIGGTPTFPSSVVTLTGSQTLTNKILTSPTITSPTITNATISADAIVGYSSSNTGTIYGISVTSSTIGAAALASNAVTTAKISDGAVTPAKLTASTGSSWAMQSWVPTWTNLATGNGTLNYAKYIQIGKMIYFRLSFVWGSTTSISGNVSVSLPATAAYSSSTGFEPVGFGVCYDSSATTPYPLTLATTNSTTTARLLADNGTNLTSVTSTVPMTWTTSDAIQIEGFYEAA